MLDPKASNRRSTANEAAVEEQFKKLGYLVEKLDRKASKGRRPDFLISNSARQRQLLCEVKTVDSAFYPRDKEKYGVADVHISTLDDKFIGSFKNIPIELRTIDRALANAITQRNALVEGDPSFADLPLLVALFLDAFVAEYLFAYPRSFDERDASFREVSGILWIKEDVERTKAFLKLSDEAQERHLRAELERASSSDPNAEVMDDDLPSHTKDFVLVKNEGAIRVVPTEFERQCLSDDPAYYC
jgi:hypothetical protein